MTQKTLTLSRDASLAEQERAVIEAFFADKTANLMVAEAVFASAQRAVFDMLRQVKVPCSLTVRLRTGGGETYAYACEWGGRGAAEVVVSRD